MSRNQRIAFLTLAAVFAVIAVLIVVEREDDPTRPTSTAAPVATTPVTTPAGPATPATTTAEPAKPAPTVLERGEQGRVEVSKGDRVRFVVRSDIADEVHLHGYDIAKDVKAGGSVTFSFKADITGIFEIELENAGEALGKLIVNP